MENARTAEQQSPPAYYGYQPVKGEHPGEPVQSTVVTIVPEGPPVRDHIIWSLINAIYLNCCCLGVIALAFSVKSRDSKLLGDKNRARSYGSTARSLNIAATVISGLALIIVTAVYAATIIALFSQMKQQPRDEFPFNKDQWNGK